REPRLERTARGAARADARDLAGHGAPGPPGDHRGGAAAAEGDARRGAALTARAGARRRRAVTRGARVTAQLEVADAAAPAQPSCSSTVAKECGGRVISRRPSCSSSRTP